MQYLGNILCITGSELLKVVSEPMYKALKARKQMNVVQRACYGKPALIEFASLPARYKELFKEPTTGSTFKDKVKADPAAVEFYSHYVLADGRVLDTKYQRQYAADAAVLNALREIYNDMKDARKALSAGVRGFWAKALEAVEESRTELGHNLPGSEAKLKVKYKEYCDNGYAALVSKKFCNDNSRKVSSSIERMLMSLYVMPNKPFGVDVLSMYQSFMSGLLEVADSKTGELFKPSDFYLNGKPIEISKSTVWNYLNQPDNRSTVDSKRSGQFQFNSIHRPHHHRTAPQFSFSKISMDDRDLPRKLIGGTRVKAYYAYDVTSGCVIGRSYSRNKDEALFIDCMQDMFRLIDREGFGMPLEVEVENHLVSKFFDDLAVMFPFVRICNPGNSQEKHAEHLNRAKKYGTEKQQQNGIGRWWAKSEAYRVDQDKVNDAFTEKAFTYERLVADDLAAVADFNNQMHPKQKKYPGKTRWQVLQENMNPNTAKVAKPVVYKAIGECTTTSITRNQYVRVQYTDYQLPSPAIINRLLPGNYNVEAYYMADSEGMIGEVYLYQNGTYLCKAEKIEQYNTAKAEWTDNDGTAYTNQAKYVSEFDKRKKEARKSLINVSIENPEVMKEAIKQEVKIVKPVAPETDDIAALLSNYNPAEYALNSRNQL